MHAHDHAHVPRTGCTKRAHTRAHLCCTLVTRGHHRQMTASPPACTSPSMVHGCSAGKPHGA
eukprot:364798-Chlamydomonas_euryale.AAC.11